MEIIISEIGYAQYMVNIRKAWVQEDVKHAHRMATGLQTTWRGILSVMDENPSIEFQEIVNNIKILIEQIEEYGDKQCNQ